MPKLSDADVTRIRELASDGHSAAQLAPMFKLSRQYVGRLLRGEARPQIGGLDRTLATGSVLRATDQFLADLEVSAADEVLAESARAMAAKLDQVRDSVTGAAAAAAPAIARQLVDVVAALRGSAKAPDQVDELIRRREARRLALMSAGNHAGNAMEGTRCR